MTEATHRRVAIRGVRPQVEAGRFPARGIAGEPVEVAADVYADSHDALGAVMRWREEDGSWREVRMEPQGNDEWTAAFVPPRPGRYEFTVLGWIDHLETWRRDLRVKHQAGVVEPVDWAVGAQLLRGLDAEGEDAAQLTKAADRFAEQAGATDDEAAEEAVELALSEELAALLRTNDPRRAAVRHEILRLHVDRPRARFSSWYELFPRSTGPRGEHGTLRDVIDELDRIAGMGFDILYLPPIHPIGTTHRKGRDNIPEAAIGDPGSPWAIGSPEGGHKSIHPELGTFEDFRALREACEEAGLELALDIAFQCSPDHPYVSEHPEWFRRRPDGTIQYAENPPKKYQDIYPFDFETEDAEGLWHELESIFRFWIDRGVRIFRVDNPHTKTFPFWEWCIDRLTGDHPDLILLSEAFTRPKVMEELAKRGFDQSYTYFPWRQGKHELRRYHEQLSRRPTVDFFRGNAWPNTPDILTHQLQLGGRPRFVQRLVLAATLSANYGIYGPPFELMADEAREGAEEYAGNEKYEIRDWPTDPDDSLEEVIARVNRIRHQHPALQSDRRLVFHDIDNEQLLAYSKTTPDRRDVILVVVNLDPDWTQSGYLHLDLEALDLAGDGDYHVDDLLGGQRFAWEGPDNYVELDPHVSSAHIFQVRRARDDEHDFPYF